MQKGFAPILLLVGVLILAVVGGGAYFLGKLPIKPADNSKKACTLEAKICPDGSSVERSGPNCEFAPCPSVSPQSLNASPLPKDTEETANWKTYSFNRTNSSLPRFEIKYPQSWDYQEISAGNPLHLIFYSQQIGDVSRQVTDTLGVVSKSPKAPIELIIFLKSPSYNANNPCFGLPADNSCLDQNEPRAVSVAGIPAKDFSLKAYPKIVEFVYSDYIFSFRRHTKSNTTHLVPTEEQRVLDQILSTFKFLP